MNQSLQMPFVETSMPTASVLRWSVQPGEVFDFGDQLCVMLVEDALFLRKVRAAKGLVGSRHKKKGSQHRIKSQPVGSLHFEVVAAEPGTMRDHVAPVGESVAVGEVLAVLQTSDATYTPTASQDLAALAPLRVAANQIEVEEDCV